MDRAINKLWAECKNHMAANPYVAYTGKQILGYGCKTTNYYASQHTEQHKLLSTILSAGLQEDLYTQRNNPQLATIVAKTIEEKKQKQYTTLLSMFPCVEWLCDSEWIYNPLYKHSLVVLQSVVNYLAQNPVYQKTYQDSDLEGRQYQRPIADIDEAGDLALSEYAYPAAMRLQRIMSGEALVTKQRAKTKRKVGRLLMLDTSHSMTTGVADGSDYATWSADNIQRWVYALAVVIDSLNNLQKYGGVLYVTSFSDQITEYGQITVDNAVQWLADEIKPCGTWVAGNQTKDFFPYATHALSSMAVDDLELVVVTDGEIPVPVIDLGATKCHVFGMATDNPKLQALTQQTGGVYMRLDKIQ